ncbi:MAG: ComF family protein [Rhizobiaceae bacterium]|nr:ComF family protein [Rhizobiaceae bacterium]
MNKPEMSASHLKNWIACSAGKFLNILVPPRCANCNGISTDQSAICAGCWIQIRKIDRPFCEVMGTPFSVDLGEGAISTEAMSNPPPFDRLRSSVLYDDIARRLISRFKFSDRSDLAPFIASSMERSGRELFEDADIITPLPLHWRRMLSRRFNQSAVLAKLISQRLRASGREIPLEPMLLSRIKNTKQQIGLSQEGRQRNVSGAFRVPVAMRPRLIGKRVLIIDDVYTSGASVKSATKALLRNGAMAVDILTFARVQTGAI